MTDTNVTLLIIEDEPLLLEAVLIKLKKLNIPCEGVTSGKDALAFLQEHSSPKAIWLDYYLKDMNGLEFLTEVKKNPEWAQIPVIVVSNSANDEKVQAMLALGANEYLLKAEHRLDDLIETVKKYIQ